MQFFIQQDIYIHIHQVKWKGQEWINQSCINYYFFSSKCMHTHRCNPHDVRKRYRGTRIWCLAKDGVRGLKPCLLIGPDNITKGQDGGSNPNSRSIYSSNNWFLELEKCVHKCPENRSLTIKYYNSIQLTSNNSLK